jgi:choline dehydrogenase-like flavoprotein
MENPDPLIVGAGPVGSVAAERASRLLGWRCLVIEKRNHYSGNCFDMMHLEFAFTATSLITSEPITKRSLITFLNLQDGYPKGWQNTPTSTQMRRLKKP